MTQQFFKSFQELPIIVCGIKSEYICLVSQARDSLAPPLPTASSPRGLQHDFSLLHLLHSWSPPRFASVIPHLDGLLSAINFIQTCASRLLSTSPFSAALTSHTNPSYSLLFLPNIPQYLLPYYANWALDYTFSCTLVQCFSNFDGQKNYRVLQNIKNKITTCPTIPLLSIYPKELKAGSLRDIFIYPCVQQHYSQQAKAENNPSVHR